MSPENARVFVAEDDKDWQRFIEDYIKEGGHTMVLLAKTRQEALEMVKQFKELGIQVAIIDGNLNSIITNGSDGQAVLAAIRIQSPEVKTIGMSSLNVRGTDVDLGKCNVRELGDVIKNL